ncbi:bifunctional 2-C-methyl-D-erythritol 4-phosphate cytidylyltransferase/2-C-methyl-D-erythritol 2,4-cyclodiphosphate synthase [Blastochloris tepida]|uniref:Bifunctional enzyme IspD/IspF n=1 Tax=Blastochloris tepida TaxID=2233851 RepID=A0A348G0U5_9HYPH|nr:bifunctional 2-C-methyl-D-erythritol 4-phosphate cytidylyltransferase/2-C-methyl-D-erythritol 2,4-cyclodiphosphate synthase [Blastochloris tepida]BBF93178.1 bifunctional enzyme IspD/IspF [Blastochloris tepida]
MSHARSDRPKTAALIVAAGRGVRAGGDVPKQYRPVLGRCALARSLALFAGHPEVDVVQPVIGEADGPLYAQLADPAPAVLAPVTGGATRQASVRAGLAALAAHAPDVVLIHDAARPFASDALVSRAIAAGRLGPAVPGVPVTDTIKAVDGAEKIESTVDRTRLRAVQTPQAFPFALIQDLHARAAAAGRDDFTDDAALAEWAGLPATVFAGEPGNIKLTTPEDFTSSEARLLAALADVRTGSGFDVHAFGDGDHVILGGHVIPHNRGLAGHSDADVVLHALTDAVLGAIGSGDIGFHFPPSDPKWKGASSDQFLAHAISLVKERGGLVAHLDATVICEAPKIGPHREAMRAAIARITGLPVERVSVKATTTEQLGFAGRREGIAALASATVRLPWGSP